MNREVENLTFNVKYGEEEESDREKRLKDREAAKQENFKKAVSKKNKKEKSSVVLSPPETPVEDEDKAFYDAEEKVENPEVVTQPEVVIMTDSTNISSDPVLKDLSPSKLTYIASLLSKSKDEKKNAQIEVSSMRVVPINPAIHIPYYDDANMTSETFLSQCELYLQSQGYTRAQFHQVISIILSGDVGKKLWYDNVSKSINSWDEFSAAFKSKFDSPLIQEKRRARLCRKQNFDEPVEQYVYEMVNLARQINSNEDESISVLRAKRGLNPDLRLYIGECKTVNELLESASLAIENIRASDRMNSRHTRLPPFSISNQRGGFHGNRHQQSSFGRGRGRFFNSPTPQGSSYNRSQFQSSNFNNQQSSRNANEYQFRPRLGSAPSRFQNQSQSNIICHSCKGEGHIARNCTNRQGPNVSQGQNPGTSGTQLVPYNPVNQQRNYQPNNQQQQTGNLNYQGR